VVVSAPPERLAMCMYRAGDRSIGDLAVSKLSAVQAPRVEEASGSLCLLVGYGRVRKVYTYPSTLVLSAGGEPLNVVRSTHSLLKHTNVAMMLDNEAISICRRS
jgi:hypothetical protein